MPRLSVAALSRESPASTCGCDEMGDTVKQAGVEPAITDTVITKPVRIEFVILEPVIIEPAVID